MLDLTLAAAGALWRLADPGDWALFALFAACAFLLLATVDQAWREWWRRPEPEGGAR